MCKHKLYFLESSKVVYENKTYYLDKYVCSECGKLCIWDKGEKKVISFNGLLGEEIDDRR